MARLPHDENAASQETPRVETRGASLPLPPSRPACYNRPMTNTLFYGDNLSILSQHVGDATVDLVYLDPPFNSNRDYNVLF